MTTEAATKPTEPAHDDGVAVEMEAATTDLEGDKAMAFQSRPVEPVCLRWNGLSYFVPTGDGEKQILKEVTGVLKPGELTAIMGPSGAGKTTMMNVLAGRAPAGKSSGSVTLNGSEVDPVEYRKKLAYVMQEDALFATQTPRECLEFTAALRLPEVEAEERKELVDGAIAALGLTRCADTMIGSALMPGLSGGEKKRTAVAVELISSPSLIFLDEPTSGLDSYSAYELIKILRALADKGSTIVCTIHQPSSEVFELFHKVFLLRSGSVVYNGPVDGLVDHFAESGFHCKANHNPADFAMLQLQTLSDEEVAPLVARVQPVKCSSDIDGMNAEGGWTLRQAGLHIQISQLLKREFYQFIRDKQTLGARFGVGVILSILVGVIFFGVGDEFGEDGNVQDIENKINNHWGAVVFSAINGMFLAAQPMLLVFPLERGVFIREYTSGTYGTIPYFLAKTLIDVPATFIQQVISLVALYFMVDLQGSYILLTLVFTLLAASSASTALLLGSATTDATTAINLTPVVYVPQILFAGFFISSDAIPVFMRWIQWICPLKYGVILATIVEFADDAIPDNRSTYVDGLINRTEINRDDWWIYTIIMLAIFVSFRVIAAIVLSRRAKTFQ